MGSGLLDVEVVGGMALVEMDNSGISDLLCQLAWGF